MITYTVKSPIADTSNEWTTLFKRQIFMDLNSDISYEISLLTFSWLDESMRNDVLSPSVCNSE